MAGDLERLDKLISGLEAAIAEVDEVDFFIPPGGQPLRATLSLVSGAYATLADRKPRDAEALRLEDAELLLKSRTDVARGMSVEAVIQVEKNSAGELLRVCGGRVLETRKVHGGYEIRIKVEELHKDEISAGMRLSECAQKGDSATWNRWVADLADGPVVSDQDLSSASMEDFDLCCADLSGSDLRGANLMGANLAGANLAECMLENVQISGADLFRAKLPRRYMGLLLASGMVEVESVVLVD